MLFGRDACASSAAASSRRTAASSSPIARRTRRSATPISRSSRQGDAVEAIYEGWALPARPGNIGIDTPDLLPERTAVHDATIELALPAGLQWLALEPPAPRQGRGARREGGKRVLAWHVKDRAGAPRRGRRPKMDRNVGVSFSTTTWDDVARGLRETLASLDEHDPEVTAWAREAGAGGQDAAPRASSSTRSSRRPAQAVKEASGVVLADVDLGRRRPAGA